MSSESEGSDQPVVASSWRRNFRKYARRTFVGDDSVWNWLALAQHHGLPTRLIDWSYSPYVGPALRHRARALSRVADSLEALVDLAEEPLILFLEPPSLDDRIINQAALFSFMSTADAQFDDWLERRPDACRRVVIPASLKWEVRDRLDQINLTERVLSPGLDGLSAWLARYYRER